MRLTPAAAAAAAGGAMLAVYAATLAPGVTFWDAGELIAAVESLGVPHPPGVPLYVLAARAFSDLMPGLSRAASVNLFSAVCTAGAVAVLAALLTRWWGRATVGIAGAVLAGSGSSVWRNAVEAEVYAPAMLVALLVLYAADRAATATEPRRTRWLALAAYLLALSLPLHLGVLVVAPAAMVRVALGVDGAARWRDALLLLGITVVAAAVGRGSVVMLAVGASVLAGALAVTGRRAIPTVAACLGAAVLAASAVGYIPVRAMHDPGINTGFATSWEGVLALLARTQYDVPGLWPRQAPLWLQLANWFQYADWQWALGLGRDVQPTVGRTLVTVIIAALGIGGARAHWRHDRRSALVLATLFGGATVGLVLYMNFKAGASFGYGVLPDDAPHEARDRDYFFLLGFLVWGAWAGAGLATWLATRRHALAPAAVVLAAAPVALNWRAVAPPPAVHAQLPRTVASALLWSAPPNAVLVTGGDNDSFPLWYEQIVHGARPDVRVVVAPLLGAQWYRAEIARRDSLLPDTVVARWRGERETLAALDAAARARGRPLALALTATEHRWLIPARERSIRGVVLARVPRATGAWLPEAAAVLDTAAVRAYLARYAEVIAAAPPSPSIDPTPRVMHAMLACPRAMRETIGMRDASLAPPCSFR
ncbi:MAG TPA: DUF2723 domain-containing protein [Gemmatimonadaceae bacterium]|nr:DUF2723 domain-containing protein [Gemmatimonadaceae bacterium]